MQGERIICVFGLLAFTLAGSQAVAGGKAERKKQRAIAAKIVEQVAGVKSGDKVIVGGNIKDIDWIEDISIETMKQGAEALQLLGSGTFMRRYFDEVPAARDADPLPMAKGLVEAVDVYINIGREDDPGLLKKVPAERLTKFSQARKPIYETLHTRGVRRVYLGNGLYPTKATAKQYGLSLKQLEQIFWAGLDVDYPKLQQTAKKLEGILEQGKQIHVTNKNGTDLKFGIEKQAVKVSDGVISDQDAKAGGAATMVWLPAGEVMTVAAPGTAEGKVVFDRFPYADGEIREMVLTFKAGKLDKVTAKPNAQFKRWKEFYAAAKEAGKDDFSWFNFGINPKVKIPKGSKLVNWTPAGMVSCGIGGNQFVGGQNTAQFGAGGFIPGSTVKVDEQVLVDKGKLKI